MGLFLQDALEKLDVHTRVLSAIDIPQLAESFISPARDSPPRKSVA